VSVLGDELTRLYLPKLRCSLLHGAKNWRANRRGAPFIV
jgi:hypothetical protein